jgi:cell division protein ZapA
MRQVTVQLNGRNYRLSCGDGEEKRLLDLADHIRQRIDDLSYEFKNSGDERLLVMAAIMITDELWDAQAKIAALEASGAVAPELDLAETVAMEPEPAGSPPDGHQPAAPIAMDEPHVSEPSLKRALRRQSSAANGTFTERLAAAQVAKSG